MTYGGYGARRGIPTQWIVAAIIALAGLGTYFFHTQTNPVTGEKQHIAISVEQEEALGLQAAPQMAQQMGGALDPASDRSAALVQEMGRKLVEKSDAARSPYANNFHYYLLADPQTINAFALPGGQVFITRGLLDRLQTEAQLAGVLGHETGHVINRHAAEQMAKGHLGQMLAAAVGVGASDDRGRGYGAAVTAQMVNQMAQLHFSRQDELEADHYGLKYMAQAGYDPSAMLQVMEILKQAAGSSHGSSFFQTHPDPDARIAAIKEYLAKTYPNAVPADLTQGAKINQ
jgi:predicted Zn-dependent protease